MPFYPITIHSVNILDRMVSRTLTQFLGSPVFQGVLAAFASEIQALSNAIVGVMQSFVPAGASGVQLDAIGRIVGSNRGLVTFGKWFTPDSPYYGQPDIDNPVWVTNAPLGGTYSMDDNTYRQHILAKIFRNFVKVGSITDIQGFIRAMFNIESSVILTGPNQVEILVPLGTSPSIVSFLAASFSNNQTETIYNVPLPPGVQLAETIAIGLLVDLVTGLTYSLQTTNGVLNSQRVSISAVGVTPIILKDSTGQLYQVAISDSNLETIPVETGSLKNILLTDTDDGFIYRLSMVILTEGGSALLSTERVS